jgi:CP family cyanate transporter-like MFS transporter
MNYRHATVAVSRPFALLAGLLLIATTLRAPITGVGPLLGTLETAFDLSPAQAGMLTSLPLLAFALISPFAALFAREYGLERTLFGALLLIAAGLIVRSAGPAWCLYLGTGVVGCAIAVGNVLLPSIVKRDFPANVPAVTGACALAMGVSAALVSACAVPLGNAFGWQAALETAFVFPLVAVGLWSVQLGSHTAPAKGTATPPHGGRVWRCALAWHVTLFMGINSLLYYVLISWLPSILIEAGYSPAAAGSLHGVMQLASALPGLLLALIVNRMNDQKRIAVVMGMLMAAALMGLRLAPHWAPVWAFVFGVGSGGGILLALIFMGLRSKSASQAAALSGMAQCVGYLLAAGGPSLVGKLHDLTGGWGMPLTIGTLLSLAMAVLGALAGRSRQI